MTEQAIHTRRTALSMGIKFYFTGKKCKNGHLTQRRTVDGSCCDCRLLLSAKYRVTHISQCREAVRRHYQDNKDYYKQNANEWGKHNQDKVKTAKADWRNSEHGKIYKAEDLARRRASEIHATPSWLTERDKQELRLFYQKARELTAATDIKHHVDHIIPLNGKCISGLHVPWNLQVLTESANIRKSNKVEGDD